MKPSLWYVLVSFNIILLIATFINKNIYLAIVCLGLAMYLNKYKNDIPLPKYFKEHKVVHFSKNNNNKGRK